MSKADKFKAKAKELGEKISNTGSVIGGIKGLFRGYDQISDKPKGGFHGFHSSSGFQGGGSGFNGSNSSQGFSNPSVSAGGAPQGKFSGFGSGSSAPSSQLHSSSPWDTSAGSSNRKSKKSKKEEKFYSDDETESESSEESQSSEDEETRKAREKEERRKARKEQKRAEAAAAEEAAKAQRREARRAKKEAKHRTEAASPVATSPVAVEKKYEDMDKAERKEYRRLKREAKRRTTGDELQVGEVVMYKNRDKVTIKAAHYDDVEPYFTVTTKSGREKQTPLSNLTRMAAALVAAAPEAALTVAAVGHDFSGGSYTNDIESLQKVLRSLRESLGEDWVRSITARFKEMSGGSDMIDLEQFTKIAGQWSWTNRMTGTVVTSPDNEIEGWFRSSDRNGDGLIDIREFLLSSALSEVEWDVLDKTDGQLLTERAAALFRMYDADQDDLMTLQDLVDMLKMLHRVCGSAEDEQSIAQEARQILKVLPTGTFLHGISLPSFVQAVKRKDIFQGVSELLNQGFRPTKRAPEQELDDLADDFAQQVNFNKSAPTSLDDLDTVPSPASVTPASANSDGSKQLLDMSTFFSPTQDSSSDEAEDNSGSDGYEDLLG